MRNSWFGDNVALKGMKCSEKLRSSQDRISTLQNLFNHIRKRDGYGEEKQKYFIIGLKMKKRNSWLNFKMVKKRKYI